MVVLSTSGCSPTALSSFSSIIAMSNTTTGSSSTPDVEVGNGVLLWFGEVADFDDVVGRAEPAQGADRASASPQSA